MENIRYIYNILINKNKFYISYFRIFLIFFSEKNKLKLSYNIKLNELSFITTQNNNLIKTCNKLVDINSNLQTLFLINGTNLFAHHMQKNIKISKINKTSNLKNFFRYKIFNTLNFYYILNFTLLKNEVKILISKDVIKNKKLYIINIFDNSYKENIILTRKIFSIKNNIKILDIYISNLKEKSINIDSFLNVKKKIKVEYGLFNKSNAINRMCLNFFTRQEFNSKLKFYDFLSDTIDMEITYNFFLIGKNSQLIKKSFKQSRRKNLDLRVCNIYHYNNNSKSNILFGALLDKESKLTFDGNIFVGTNIKNIEAHLKCEGLILSDLSSMEFNPNMFINNSEVKCTHGVSIGNITDYIKNYIKSRGINDAECKKILLYAFKKKFININNLTIKNIYKNLNNKFNYE